MGKISDVRNENMTNEEFHEAILNLKQLLSKSDLSQLCFRTFFTIQSQGFFKDITITSPLKQCSYIISMALNTPASEELEQLSEDNWKEILVLSEKIFGYYPISYSSEEANFLSEENHYKAGIVMFTFLLELGNFSLLSVEQLLEEINELYSPFNRENR